MSIVSTIVKRGLLHKSFPAESPAFTLSKDQQDKLNQGECLLITDTYYQAKWIVRKDQMNQPLSKENLCIDAGENMKLNPVRQQELNNFYNKYPQYKRDV